MSQTASVALAAARTLLNDDGQQLWTDPVLLPKLQFAHRELQVQLRANACPVTRVVLADLLVNANAKALPTNPTDMIEPIALWEKDPADSQDKYVKMTESDPLPFVYPAVRLIYWKWTQEAIEFLGATSNRHVKMLYKHMIQVPAAATDSLGAIDAELFIGPRTAALAFGSTGNAAAADWCTNMAVQSLTDILVANKGRARTAQRP